jgi:hypothetical protein
MAGLVPAIHVLLCGAQDVDARHKAGHDDGMPCINATGMQPNPKLRVS